MERPGATAEGEHADQQEYDSIEGKPRFLSGKQRWRERSLLMGAFPLEA